MNQKQKKLVSQNQRTGRTSEYGRCWRISNIIIIKLSGRKPSLFLSKKEDSLV